MTGRTLGVAAEVPEQTPPQGFLYDRLCAMDSSLLNRVRKINVESTVVTATLNVLRQFGAHECEGLVLWLGDILQDRAHAREIIVPNQRPIKDERGVGYFVDGRVLFELNRILADTGLRLIAQVHSHPGEAYHSEADDRFAIVTADGSLSLVVPNFAQASDDPRDWAVYRLTRGSWRELSSEETHSLLTVGEFT